MIVPTVHLNGTAKIDLIGLVETAHFALNVAIERLQETAPNARDYYVQKDPGAFSKARAEHEARMHKLADVANELIQLHEGISDQ